MYLCFGSIYSLYGCLIFNCSSVKRFKLLGRMVVVRSYHVMQLLGHSRREATALLEAKPSDGPFTWFGECEAVLTGVGPRFPCRRDCGQMFTRRFNRNRHENNRCHLRLQQNRPVSSNHHIPLLFAFCMYLHFTLVQLDELMKRFLLMKPPNIRNFCNLIHQSSNVYAIISES